MKYQKNTFEIYVLKKILRIGKFSLSKKKKKSRNFGKWTRVSLSIFVYLGVNVFKIVVVTDMQPNMKKPKKHRCIICYHKFTAQLHNLGIFNILGVFTIKTMAAYMVMIFQNQNKNFSKLHNCTT